MSEETLFQVHKPPSDTSSLFMRFILLHLFDIHCTVMGMIFFADITSQYLAHPVNVTKRLGETAAFDCTIKESLPYASIQWYKDGNLFTQGEVAGQFHIPNTKATSSALSVKSITFSSAGWYWCVAINPLLPSQPQSSKRAYLTVLRKYSQIVCDLCRSSACRSLLAHVFSLSNPY